MTVRILTGDCKDLMRDEGPFDMIIADPPYGDTSLDWDKQTLEWIEIAAHRLKATGSMWLFGSMKSLLRMWPFLDRRGWRVAQDIVWEKQNGSAFHADRFKRVHEHVLHLYRWGAWSDIYNEVQTTSDATARTVRRKRRPPHTGHIEAGAYASQDGGPRIMRSVIQIPNCHGHAIHPTEKPVDLLQILIRTSCPPGGLVGDFFAGSGAAADACVAAGRDYIGCEIDPAMAAKAAHRSLFVAASAV